MHKVNPKNRNETKSDIFPWDIFKCDTISSSIKNFFKYFNHFQKELKQNQTFFRDIYVCNLHHISYILRVFAM